MHPRWTKLFEAVKRWWKDEPLPPPDPDFLYLGHVRKLLEDYDQLYCQRTKIYHHGFSSQAAAAVEAEGHKRSPGLESEIRVLALALERLANEVEHQGCRR